MRDLVRDVRQLLISSDPGLNRLRTAVRAVVSVGTALGIEYLFAPVTGESSTIAMLLGAVLAMLASMGVTDQTAAGKAVTMAFFPVAMSAGLVLGALVSSRHLLSLVAFVAVMFGAVWARRFGMRFFMYGMLAWMGYFMADLLAASLSEYPRLLFIVVVATAWVLLLRLTIFRDNPARDLRRTFQSLELRA